jgi:two-component system nitrogen regulation response regulator GlnG
MGVPVAAPALEDVLAVWLPGVSPAIRDFRHQLAACLESERPVLLVGEPGSGKQRAARILHSLSGRAEGPFVLFDVAIPVQRQVARAAGGTLLIDDLDGCGDSVQEELMRWVVAWDWSAPATPRLIVTARDGEEAEGPGFEAFLLAERGAIRLFVPSLRARFEDLPVLCAVLLAAEGASGVTGVTPDGFAYLASRAWPGNIRELREGLQRAAAAGGGRPLDAATLERAFLAEGRGGAAAGRAPSPDSVAAGGLSGMLARCFDLMLDASGPIMPDLHARLIAAIERPLIERALKFTDGNQVKAAALLGLNRNTLRTRMQALGIEPARRKAVR